MTNDRIMEIARQFEAYRDNKVPTVRGDDLVLFARQVIDEQFEEIRRSMSLLANQNASNERP